MYQVIRRAIQVCCLFLKIRLAGCLPVDSLSHRRTQ
jgi:hypothetical protein